MRTTEIFKNGKAMKTTCCHSKNYTVLENQVICINEHCDNFLKPTRFQKSSTVKYLVAMAFFGLFFIRSYDDYCFSENSNNIHAKMSVHADQIPLTSENLKFEIERQEIFCADEVYAQMQLESGRLSSFLVKRANNLLGMRY